MANSNAFREFEKRANALRFDLNGEARKSYKEAQDRNQEIGKDAQYWIAIGEANAYQKSIDMLNSVLESNLNLD